ncbi:hypothetical protein NEFER03_0721 [Nematocida sp. LUAm3]|nr:hypothetical protein NEFER03_0721 [Nematocida sp. LUAm3]
MLAQGRDIVAVAIGGEEEKEEVMGYRVSTGMEKSFLIGAVEGAYVSAVGCCPLDRFVLVGYSNGAVRVVYPGAREVLHEEELFILSLRVTCFWVSEEMLYVSSENGTVRVYGIELEEEKEEKGKEEESVGGWMDPIEAFKEETEDSVTFSFREKKIFSFKYIREIEHTTPVEQIAVGGRNIYLLDMRKRVKILNTSVVYDTLSIIMYNRYFFCSEDNTLFVEAGKTLISYYFCSEKIEKIRSTRLGKYLFLITKSGIELISIEKKKGKLIQKLEKEKNLLDIVIDSDRSIIYGVYPNKVSRLSISSIWIDKEPCELEVNESSMKRKYVEEEEEEDKYYDVPLPKSIRSAPYAIRNTTAHAIAHGKLNGKLNGQDDEIIDLFEESEDAPGDTPEETGTAKITITDENTEIGSITGSITGIGNITGSGSEIFGSIFLTEGKTTLAFWSPTCKVLFSSLGETNRIEVTLRGKSQRILEVNDSIKEIEMVSCSEDILLIYGEDTLHIYKIFDSSLGKVIEYLPKRKIKRISCGKEYFSLITEQEVDALEIYSVSPRISEIFCASEVFKGIFSSNEYTVYITNNNKITLIKITNGFPEVIFSLLSPIPITKCFVDAFGVVLVSSNKSFYGVTRNRIFPVSCEVKGVPLGITMNYLAYIPTTHEGTISLFPENVAYAPITRDSAINTRATSHTTSLTEEHDDVHRAMVEEGKRHTAHYVTEHAPQQHAPPQQYLTEYATNEHVPVRDTVRDTVRSVVSDTERDVVPERLITTPIKKVKLLNPFSKSKTRPER